MASAEGGSVPNAVKYGEGCSLPSPLEGLGSVVSSPVGSGPEARSETDIAVF